jgi:hypothetical protein
MNEDSYTHGIYDLTFGEFIVIYREELSIKYASGDGLDEFADFALAEYNFYLRTPSEPDILPIDEENHFDEILY